MSVTANFGWDLPEDREQLLEILLRQIFTDIDADLKTYANTPYAARVYNAANISVANATGTALTFNSERRDDGSLHSTSVNTDRLTAPVTGWYMLWGNVEFAVNATGFRTVSFRVGATPDIYGAEQAAAVAGDTTIIGATCLIHLTAGDYVRLFVYQTSGGALNVIYTAGGSASARYSPEFGMILLKRTA